MALFLVTPPAVEPLALRETKKHLRVVVDDENDLIVGLIRAAREYVENFTNRALIARVYDDKRRGFPCESDEIQLPKAPLLTTTVPVVTYLDTNGDSQTWASMNYTVDAPSDPQGRPGRLYLNYGKYFPVTQDVENAVVIRFHAGYGTTRETIPESIRQAMKILINTWFAPGRQSVVIGNIVSEVPDTVKALLWPFRCN